MVTKFEPKFAHTFLPCWDEPSIKTTFNVSILHEKHFNMALSNMPVNFQKNESAALYYNNKVIIIILFYFNFILKSNQVFNKYLF